MFCLQNILSSFWTNWLGKRFAKCLMIFTSSCLGGNHTTSITYMLWPLWKNIGLEPAEGGDQQIWCLLWWIGLKSDRHILPSEKNYVLPAWTQFDHCSEPTPSMGCVYFCGLGASNFKWLWNDSLKITVWWSLLNFSFSVSTIYNCRWLSKV